MNPFKVGDEVVRKSGTETHAWIEFHLHKPRRVYTIVGVYKMGVQLSSPWSPRFFYGNFEYASPLKLEEML